MTTTRKSGILLHPTSLPGDLGIGDLGVWARRFADFLAESGQRYWQILPLGPTGFGYSPYQACSSMAGNPLLISPQWLIEQGWLTYGDLRDVPSFPADRVDFAAVAPVKLRLLRQAARNFFAACSSSNQIFGQTTNQISSQIPNQISHQISQWISKFDNFCRENADWLLPYARFAALREAHDGAPWTEWDPAQSADADLQAEQEFIQFVFYEQWLDLRRYCNERGIELIGDIPIFVAHDSADVWAHQQLFDLDEKGNPLHVAGVPPDYFSETGQRWGNPLYRWEAMARDGYQWWIARVRAAMRLTDIIRLDHFRGFEKFYQIPASAPTAATGAWIEGPGDRLFKALRDACGPLPFIAEDLGYITPEVQALRDHWQFPGMRVMQFGFDSESPDNPHKPYNFVKNCVAYTGTHDNATTAGWFADAATRAQGEAALAYIGAEGSPEPVWSFIQLALASVADTVIVPMQDVLELGAAARMNTPSTTGGNWLWRMRPDALRPELATRLGALNRRYGR